MQELEAIIAVGVPRFRELAKERAGPMAASRPRARNPDHARSS